MQLITSNKASKTMSSREIAELTGKRHDNVKRDINVMCQELEISPASLRSEFKASNGQVYTEYRLGLHHTATLVSGYSIKARMAVIKKVSNAAIVEAINDFDASEEMPDMYVYAICEVETGRIKLGISRDPEARLKQLQTGNSQRLELIAYRKAGAGHQDEKELHLMNAGHRIRGEWFSNQATLEQLQ